MNDEKIFRPSKNEAWQMTSIVFYRNDTMPTFHADTLITAGVPINGIVKTPQWTSKDRQKGPRFVTGLCQKIVVISKNFAYVWAGSLPKIREFDESIRALSNLPNEEEFFSAAISLASDYSKHGVDIGVLCKRNGNNNKIHLFGFDKVDLPRFGETFLAGSGGGAWFGDVGRVSSDLPYELKNDAVEDKTLSDMIVRWRTMESVIEMAIITGNYDNVFTGGIIETLVLDSDLVKKKDNTVFAIWDERFPFHYGVFPFQIIKRFYFGDFLCVSYFDNSSMQRDFYVIPTPQSINVTVDVPMKLFDPFYEKPDWVSCIFIRKNGKASHFSESGEIFRKHFAYCSLSGKFLISKWYYEDMKAKAVSSAEISKKYQ